jgi:predicted permease
MPAIGYALTCAAGVTGDARLIALLYLASPCAVTSYVMADQMGADKDLAGSAIVLSTLFCLPVMALILIVFGQ